MLWLFAFEHVVVILEHARALFGQRNIQGIPKNDKDEQGAEGTKDGRGCKTFPMAGHLYSR